MYVFRAGQRTLGMGSEGFAVAAARARVVLCKVPDTHLLHIPAWFSSVWMLIWTAVMFLCAERQLRWLIVLQQICLC